MQDQEKSGEKGSIPRWAPTPMFPQGNFPVGSTMGSVSVSDITENSNENENDHEPPSTVASFVQYYDPRARTQRGSEGSAEEDRGG